MYVISSAAARRLKDAVEDISYIIYDVPCIIVRYISHIITIRCIISNLHYFTIRLKDAVDELVGVDEGVRARRHEDLYVVDLCVIAYSCLVVLMLFCVLLFVVTIEMKTFLAAVSEGYVKAPGSD